MMRKSITKLLVMLQIPALIFSNSLGTNFKMWQAQIDFFQQDFFVICYDTRGHGASSAPQGPYSIDQLGQDVVNLLDHLNVEKAAFCGISMGGLTGQWLAIHRPERFNQVVVCNTAAKIGQEQAWNDRAAFGTRTRFTTDCISTAASRWFTEPFIQSNATVVNNLQTTWQLAAPKVMRAVAKLWLKRMYVNNLKKSLYLF